MILKNIITYLVKPTKEQEEYNKNHFEALEEKDELDRLIKVTKN